MKTTQEKCIIVAEESGWNTKREILGSIYIYRDLEGFPVASLPDYANDLNAIRAAVLAQDEEFQRQCANNLIGRASGLGQPRFWHQLTALDWLDCFVETLEQRRKK